MGLALSVGHRFSKRLSRFRSVPCGSADVAMTAGRLAADRVDVSVVAIDGIDLEPFEAQSKGAST